MTARWPGRASAVALVALSGLAPSTVAGAPRSAPPADDGGGLWARVAHPGRAEATRWLAEARSRAALRDPIGAAAAYAEAARAAPDDPEVQLALGLALHELGRWRGCATALSRARALQPASASYELAFTLGFCRSLAGEPGAAVGEYRRALGLTERREELRILHWNLGDSLMSIGRLAEALAEYRLAAEASPDDPVPHLAYAVALDRDEQVARSAAEVAEALRIGRGLRACLGRLRAPTVFFVPDEERDAHLALLFDAAGQPTLAEAAWRRFLERAAASPWRRRGAEHVAALAARPYDPGAIGIVELAGAGVPAPSPPPRAAPPRPPPPALDRAALRGRLAEGAEELAACLAAEGPGRHVTVRARVEAGALGMVEATEDEGTGERRSGGDAAVACLRRPLERALSRPAPAGRFDVTLPLMVRGRP